MSPNAIIASRRRLAWSIAAAAVAVGSAMIASIAVTVASALPDSGAAHYLWAGPISLITFGLLFDLVSRHESLEDAKTCPARDRARLIATTTATARLAGIEKPQIVISDAPGRTAHVTAPFFGGRRRLVVSRNLLTACDDQTLLALVAHEIAHLKHHDHALKRFVLLLVPGACGLLALGVAVLFCMEAGQVLKTLSLSGLAFTGMFGLLLLHTVAMERASLLQELNADLWSVTLTSAETCLRLHKMVAPTACLLAQFHLHNDTDQAPRALRRIVALHHLDQRARKEKAARPADASKVATTAT